MNYLKTAIEASLNAGSEILKVYSGNFDIEYKENQSPLTVADKKSNQIINEFLINTEIPIISEENEKIEYNDRKNWQLCWIVDPLDGTKEFIKKRGEFTVNIALIENGDPVLGVIYVPVSKELYYADTKIKKAFKTIVSDDEDLEEQLFLEKDQLFYKMFDNKSKIRVVSSRSHMNEDTHRFIDQLKEKYDEIDIVSKGSSLKFCLVAEGKADLYPRFAPTMEWDTAAGQAVCEAIGLKVIDQITKRPIKYNRENMLNNSFLVIGHEESII